MLDFDYLRCFWVAMFLLLRKQFYLIDHTLTLHCIVRSNANSSWHYDAIIIIIIIKFSQIWDTITRTALCSMSYVMHQGLWKNVTLWVADSLGMSSQLFSQLQYLNQCHNHVKYAIFTKSNAPISLHCWHRATSKKNTPRDKNLLHLSF